MATQRGPRQGTGFINWGQFVDANRGAAQRTASALMALSAADLSAGESQYGTGMGNIDAAIAANAIPEYAGDDVSKDEDEDRLARTTWQGPRTTADEGAFAAGTASANRALDKSKELADMYSRMGTLRDTYGKGNPGYSQGMQAFDSALLDSTSRDAFTGQQKQAQGLLDKFSAGAKDADSRLKAAQKQQADRTEVYKDAVRNRPDIDVVKRNPIATPPAYAPPSKRNKGDNWVNRAGRWMFGG